MIISLQPLLLLRLLLITTQILFIYLFLVLAVAAVTQQTAATVLVCFISCLVRQSDRY
jgi:hypothetical protein